MSDPVYILSVDDERMNQLIMSDFLGDEYELAFALNGEECFASISKRLPDLILLDINMPGINGIEVCRRLRKDPITKDIPVIFVSVCHLEKDIKASFDAG